MTRHRKGRRPEDEIAEAAIARARNWARPPTARGAALPDPRWFAVHTAAGCEVVASKKLRQAGFMTFFAFDRVRRRRKRPGTNTYIVEWIERPYFKRYIFACLRYANDSIEGIEKCHGVSRVVRRRLSGEPLEIPHDNLDKLMGFAMVRFDEQAEVAKHGYRLLMREIILDADKQITLHVNQQGKRSLSREPLADAEIA